MNLQMIERGDASNWRASTGIIAAMIAVVSLALARMSLTRARRRQGIAGLLFILIVAAVTAVGSFALRDVSALTR